jgi:hypothetical protein
MDILSSATPSLRFSAFFGCHGPGIPKQYEVEYEYDKTPGHHAFFYNEDALLFANFLLIDDLKKLLKRTIQQLENLGTLGGPAELVRGIAPTPNDPELGNTVLKIRVKDVVPSIEPRFVYVNGRIVGMLGASPENSNSDTGVTELEYPVPALALQTRKSCHKIKILSSQLSEGALVDDYLIESVTLENNKWKKSKVYSPPLHLGESVAPPPPVGPEGPLRGSRRKKREQHLKYLIQLTRSLTWLDREPATWEQSPPSRQVLHRLPKVI